MAERTAARKDSCGSTDDACLLALRPLRRHLGAAVGASRGDGLDTSASSASSDSAGVAVDSEGVGVVATQLLIVYIYSAPPVGPPSQKGKASRVPTASTRSWLLFSPATVSLRSHSEPSDSGCRSDMTPLAFGGGDYGHLQSARPDFRTASEAPDAYCAAASPYQRVLRRRQHPRRLGDAPRVRRQRPGRFRLQQLHVGDFGQGFRRNFDFHRDAGGRSSGGEMLRAPSPALPPGPLRAARTW